MDRGLVIPIVAEAAAPWLIAMIALMAAASARAVSLEVYGRLPSLEEVSLSPSGARIAFVRTEGDLRVIAVKSLADRNLLARIRVNEEKLRNVEWADEDDLMIETSVTSVPDGFRGSKHEWRSLQVFDLVKHKTRRILEAARPDHLATMNVVWGRVMIRRLDGHTVLFVPGIYVEGRTLPVLMRVDLATGQERVVREGTWDTREWLVDEAGQVIAEQNYDDSDQRWALKIRRNGRLEVAASGHEPIDYPELLGFGPAADTLLMQSMEAGTPVWRLLSVKDGTLGSPMAEGRDLDAPIEDRRTYCMIGGVHMDDVAKYVFFDPARQARWDAIVRAFQGDGVHLMSWSEDFKKVVVRVDGPEFGFSYHLVDFDTHKAEPVGDVYEGLTEPLEVRRITYPAVDGLPIPAYLTLPRGRPPRLLPLIVLPHGGPVARDTAEFDWWSQALADQGYAVLRPNFRGSAISPRFVAAGFGEYGRKMQTDLSDGVRFLAKEGIADPARVCVVGASYGGYAALAGVTLDPGVYRCAVSVAGVADLDRKMKWINEKHRYESSVEQRYWDRLMGVTGPGDPELARISPIKHVDAVSVPILLIHGRDDTVVPYEQSEVMFDALKRARKDVELVTLKREDHWLSRSETRLQMLQATVNFLRRHNPPD